MSANGIDTSTASRTRVTPAAVALTDAPAPAQTSTLPAVRAQSANPASSVGQAHFSDAGVARTASSRFTLTAEEEAKIARIDAAMAQRYPALAPIVTNPAKFFSDMAARFEAQKKITPENPMSFDFTDIVVPHLKLIHGEVKKKLDEVVERRQMLERKYNQIIGSWMPGRKKDLEEARTAEAFLKDLDAELTECTGPNGKVSYLRSLQLDASCTMAMSYRGTVDHSPLERVLLSVDRYLQGLRDVPVAEAYERYKTRNYRLWETTSPVKGFRNAETVFRDAFYSQDALKMIGLATTIDIGIDVLMCLLPHHIYLGGVVRTNGVADGFVRPSKDFLGHDVRHASAILHKRHVYETEHALSPEAAEYLAKKMKIWLFDLNAQVEALPKDTKDQKQFRASIKLLAFNNHHDRGLVMAPSTYLPTKTDNTASLLYRMLRVSGQKVFFKDHNRRLPEAHQYLREYFLPKLAEEQALWNTAPKQLASAERKQLTA